MQRMKKIIKYSLLTIFIISLVYYFLPEDKLVPGQKIDRIIVNKGDREMIVYFHKEEIARYAVSLGSKKWPFPEWGPILTHDEGPKNAHGDAKTPEGEYSLTPNPGEKYQPALTLNYEKKYPKKGCCILIHGPNSKNKWAGKFMRWVDWTDGCIALTETEMKEIYEAVTPNCFIEINP